MNANLDRQKRRIALVILSGPVAWSLYFLIGYLYVEAACQLGTLSTAAVGILLGLMLLFLLPIAWGGWQGWRLAQQPGEDQADPSVLGRMAVLSALLFGLVTLITGTAVLVLPLCA